MNADELPDFFQLYLQLATTARLFIMQENGPTKFIVEDVSQKRFKVSIGTRVTCSCGAIEHCVHVVSFTLKLDRFMCC